MNMSESEKAIQGAVARQLMAKTEHSQTTIEETRVTDAPSGKLKQPVTSAHCMNRVYGGSQLLAHILHSRNP